MRAVIRLQFMKNLQKLIDNKRSQERFTKTRLLSPGSVENSMKNAYPKVNIYKVKNQANYSGHGVT